MKTLILSIFMLSIFGVEKSVYVNSTKTKGCVYYQPSVSNGILTRWDPTNGTFTAFPVCPKCSKQDNQGISGAEGYTSGKEEIIGSCINFECTKDLPKGKLSYQYKCYVSWVAPKCD
jgi:hypothetical protein